MGCATSMCSCTQTSVATVTPAGHSNERANTKNSANSGSSRARLASSILRAGTNPSNNIRTKGIFDNQSANYDADSIRNIGEVEYNRRECDGNNKYSNQNGLYNKAGELLGDNSKWTVTVRLYTQKSADQRSADIASVEETGSHISANEWPRKCASSIGSRGSANKRAHVAGPSTNGIGEQRQKPKGNGDKHIRSNWLHYSQSERPLTKQEITQHEQLLQETMNPTYAWGKGGSLYGQIHGQDHSVEGDNNAEMITGLNGLPALNGLSTVINPPKQKYEQVIGDFSSFLSLGTNHYRSTRSSLRESRQQQIVDNPETWQPLCDSSIPISRPKSAHHTENMNLKSPDKDSVHSESPVDSLLTDYLLDTDIKEDFSGSTHSLTNNKGTSVTTSGKGTSIGTSVSTSVGTSVNCTSVNGNSVKDSSGRESRVFEEQECNDNSQQKSGKKSSSRPRAALRRHRSEPFHFLV